MLGWEIKSKLGLQIFSVRLSNLGKGFKKFSSFDESCNLSLWAQTAYQKEITLELLDMKLLGRLQRLLRLKEPTHLRKIGMALNSFRFFKKPTMKFQIQTKLNVRSHSKYSTCYKLNLFVIKCELVLGLGTVCCSELPSIW